MSYTHLQVKSGYSLMNSTITIPKLVERAHKLNFNALALTDEEVLYGIIPFYRACKSYGIKPIIGMSVRLLDNEEEVIPCILLAKNNAGYHQLIKLSTTIQQDSINGIDLGAIQQAAGQLICIVPVQHDKITQLFQHQTHAGIAGYFKKWQALFAQGDFYLGLQERDESIFTLVKEFHKVSRIPVTAINDVIYLDEKDAMAFDCLQAMKTGKQWGMKIADSTIKNRHLRSETEMESLFGFFWPEVLAETAAIAGKCNVTIDFEQRLLPSFPVPEEISAADYLEKLCWAKVKERYQTLTDPIKKRLSYELHVIQSMEFSDYFLIVADFIGYAKANQIVVGPGRGSSAGSIVAYILGITDVDPMEYGLLFERFLNPERQTMPDIDVDFSDARRDEVITYVQEKYGREHVAQIITFGTFAARSLIRELIKTMDVDGQDASFMLREIPLQSTKRIPELVKESEELYRYVKTSPKLKLLFAVAVKLEGLPRHISTHAAGVVISEKPLKEHVPLTIGATDTHLTQFPMNDLEAIGLLKMDFLGLRNLTLLEKVIQSIAYTGANPISLDEIPENDTRTYELLRNGQTNGVFQLESQGMKQVLTELLPSSFEDIVAVNALYRPGPMDFIPVYIARKHGKEEVTYPHPDLKPILAHTFGVLVYQEQIMQIANRIAGFTFGEADMLRRAVSKKKQDVMDAQKEAFIQGCLNNGYERSVAEEIFSWIVKFSNYGFPRSHAVAYSKISYQLAFLKAHYPASFFAELLSASRSQYDKLHLYMQELKALGLELLPPNINRSFGKYSVENKKVRMGLTSIKSVGNQAIGEIIRARKAGPFKNIFDFCLRTSPKLVNRKTLENLIIAGAFDETYSNRASLLASIEQAMEQGELFKEFFGGSSLFEDQIELDAKYVEIDDFSQVKKLADEKELLGMYVSSHPIKEFRKQLRANGHVTLRQAAKMLGKRNLDVTVIIQAIRVIRTKRGDKMAFLTIDDEQAEMEAVIFPDVFREISSWLQEEMLVCLEGKVESRNNKLQMVINSVKPFHQETLQSDYKQRLFIKVVNMTNQQALQLIEKVAERYPGGASIILYDEQKKQSYQLAESYCLYPDKSCLNMLKRYFGNENVVLQNREV
ncbi:MAG: DNA polymerase III subunit alpha [Oceanobacillus sp.]|nr:DNA polymerase III subunit alpha [Oceanobacillus sp.]